MADCRCNNKTPEAKYAFLDGLGAGPVDVPAAHQQAEINATKLQQASQTTKTRNYMDELKRLQDAKRS